MVCDDGSSDNTAFEAQSSGALVIQHSKNQGKGAALKTLFNSAKEKNPDVVVTIDGDGQFLPNEIPQLAQPVIDNLADLVIGNRYGAKSEMPKYRKFGNKILDDITNKASDLPFEDTQSGFRAYSKKAIKSLKFTNSGFGADSEILIDAAKKKLQISEIPVTVLYKIEGDTSTKNPVSHSAGVISTILELIALRRPLLYLGVPGIILSIIGIAFSISVIAIFNETRYFSLPSTLVAVGSLVLGIFLLVGSIVLYAIGKTSKE